MAPNAADYLWFNDDRFPDLADSYCFTLVRDLTPELLMTRLGRSPWPSTSPESS
ncbi:DUF6461 domain-containing protein [Nonomuraea sp. NPDC049419]|uniref:DUF6461 domain-containing protein n=1 Tax=Nonomuraea sp. NPDC049419 TaxID=3155772 RepID=UPI00341290E2